MIALLMIIQRKLMGVTLSRKNNGWEKEER
jgi:hypothetical protein